MLSVYHVETVETNCGHTTTSMLHRNHKPFAILPSDGELGEIPYGGPLMTAREAWAMLGHLLAAEISPEKLAVVKADLEAEKDTLRMLGSHWIHVAAREDFEARQAAWLEKRAAKTNGATRRAVAAG